MKREVRRAVRERRDLTNHDDVSEGSIDGRYIIGNDEEPVKLIKECFDSETEWIHSYIHKSEKHCLNDDCSEHYFEKRFDLVNDEALLRAGVEICAVTMVKGEQVRNMIKFRREDDESFVHCVHTTVCQFVLDPDSEDGIEFLSTENRPDLRTLLAPEEHYVAMKSFVGCLAEEGIFNSLAVSYQAELEQVQDPLNINHLMRRQLLLSLVAIAPENVADSVSLTLRRGSGGDPERLTIISSEIIHLDLPEKIIRVIYENVAWYPLLRTAIACMNNLPLDLHKELARDKDAQVCLGAWDREGLPVSRLQELSNDEESVRSLLNVTFGKKTRDTGVIENKLVRKSDTSELGLRTKTRLRGVIENLTSPEKLVRKLANDPKWSVRASVATISLLPEDLVRKFASDTDGFIRWTVAGRANLPDDVLVELACEWELGSVEDLSRGVSWRLWEREDLSKRALQVLSCSERAIRTAFMLHDGQGLGPEAFPAYGIPRIKWYSDIAIMNLTPPEDLIRKLAQDPDPTIRGKVAYFKNLPKSVTKKLSKDKNQFVRDTFKDRKRAFRKRKKVK